MNPLQNTLQGKVSYATAELVKVFEGDSKEKSMGSFNVTYSELKKLIEKILANKTVTEGLIFNSLIPMQMQMQSFVPPPTRDSIPPMTSGGS